MIPVKCPDCKKGLVDVDRLTVGVITSLPDKDSRSTRGSRIVRKCHYCKTWWEISVTVPAAA